MIRMTNSLIAILKKDWMKIAESVVKKRGRRLEDLAFAKRTTQGYAFFIAKKVPWEILHEISEELAALYPHLDYAVVAEASSEIANSQESLQE